MALDNDRARTPKAARRLERAPGLGRQAVLATWADGSTGLLQERDGAVVEIARYVGRPMLAGAVRLGSRLVFASPEGDRLRVIGIGRRVVR
jgi:hypothetical protein